MAIKERTQAIAGTFAELEKAAFPEHALSLIKLRDYAYAMHAGQAVSPDDESHIASCDACQKQLARLRRTDPFLNGESEKSLKVVVHAAKDAAAKSRMATTVKASLKKSGAKAKPATLAASAFVNSVAKSGR